MLRLTETGVTFFFLCQNLSKNQAFRNPLGRNEDCTESQETKIGNHKTKSYHNKIGAATDGLMKDIGNACLLCVCFLWMDECFCISIT